jgi:sigma-B regulation protein RsbU (phosphoserine phosphatase)
LAASPGASSILWHADPESGALRPAPPLEVAEELSRRFPYDEVNHQYFTMVYGILDTSRRVLTYVSAGHPHMVRIGRDGVSTAFSSTGPPVALIPSMLGPSIYEQKEISLEPGDRLYIYSDGIPEASNSNAEEFETDRVARTLSSVLDRDLEGSIAELLDRVWEWGDGQGPDDDVSVLAVAIE